MIYEEIDNNDNILFNRETISNWENQYEKELNELQGEELKKFKTELFMKAMYIFDALVIFENKGKYGVKSRGFDKIVVPAEYDNIYACTPHFFVIEHNKKYGLIQTGYFDYKIVYPIVCDSITYAKHMMQKIQVNGKYGLLKLDDNLRVIVEPIYDSIELLGDEEFYLLKKDHKMGIYHHDVVILPEYEEIKYLIYSDGSMSRKITNGDILACTKNLQLMLMKPIYTIRFT